MSHPLLHCHVFGRQCVEPSVGNDHGSDGHAGSNRSKTSLIRLNGVIANSNRVILGPSSPSRSFGSLQSIWPNRHAPGQSFRCSHDPFPRCHAAVQVARCLPAHVDRVCTAISLADHVLCTGGQYDSVGSPSCTLSAFAGRSRAVPCLLQPPRDPLAAVAQTASPLSARGSFPAVGVQQSSRGCSRGCAGSSRVSSVAPAGLNG